MAKTTYTQCMLGGDNRRYVAWIPTKFATVGKRLTIDGTDGEWTVIERYVTKDGDYVEHCSRDHLRQRGASDI